MKMIQMVLVWFVMSVTCLASSPPRNTQIGLDKAMQAYDKGDYAKALAIWRAGAKKGNRVAQFMLGAMYLDGVGVPKSPTEAAKWFRLAAKQGHRWAQFNLGCLYSEGIGVPKDRTEAITWYTLAANQGDQNSQWNLGEMLSEEDPGAAAKWYQMGADEGDSRCQGALGFLYLLGKGVPKDSMKAYVLFLRAQKDGKPVSEPIAILEKQLSPDQIRDGKRQASKGTGLLAAMEQKSAEERILSYSFESELTPNQVFSLPSGRIVIIGSSGKFDHRTCRAALLDPSSGRLSILPTTLFEDRRPTELFPVLLTASSLFLIGYFDENKRHQLHFEVLDLETGLARKLPPLSLDFDSYGFRAVRTLDGRILFGSFSGAETYQYDPDQDRITHLSALVSFLGPGNFVIPLPKKRILVLGGTQDGDPGIVASLADSKIIQTPPTTIPRNGYAAVTMQDGRVMLLGGSKDTRTEIYDPEQNAFSLGPRMNVARKEGTVALLLKSGKVLVIGGQEMMESTPSGERRDSMSDSLEIFDPVANAFETPVLLGVRTAGYRSMAQLEIRYMLCELLSGDVAIFGSSSKGYLLFHPETRQLEKRFTDSE